MANDISRLGFKETLLNLLGQTSTGTNGSNFGNLGITPKNALDSSTRLTQLVNGSTTGTNGFRSVNLDDFLSVNKGSNAPIAIIVGNAEGTRTPSGGKTRLYNAHTDPGDSKPNIGSFSYNAGRGLGNATTPEAADRTELKELNRLRPGYESKVKAAGLDPNNSLLASTFFDESVQSPRSAQRLLRPDILNYLKTNGISAETMKEARFRSWINPETGSLYKNAKGNYEAGGFRNIAKNRLGVENPTEAQIQKVVRQDQNRRVSELVNALNKQGYGSGTTPTNGTNPTTGTTATPTETKPVSATLKFGQKSEEVKQFQDKLVKLGYLTQEQVTQGEGNFGNKTKAAVEKFQRDSGIDVDGKVGKDTRRTMEAILNGVKPGDTANQGLVKNVQNKLVELGYLTKEQIGNNGGVFGPKTEAALKAFQTANGINSTGNIGQRTTNALFNGTPKAGEAAPAETKPKVTDTAPVQTNPGTTAGSDTMINPVTGKPGLNASDISSDEGGTGGYHSRTGGKHDGIDIKGRVGDPVYAAHGGTVKKGSEGASKGYGYYVDITNPKTGFTTRYAHLDFKSWNNLQDGKTVKAGDAFAKIGRSGNVRSNRGTHVHFETRTGAGKFGRNGSLDPTPYLTGKKKLPN
jgi:murein DD-endopeptidase MepM/ murein hydrolase activator NlpD